MKIINFKSLPSTNQYLKEHYNELDEYTIVKAENQTNGRGRMNRSWQVEPNTNLTFSILLKPDYDTNTMPLVSLIAGASVYLTLKQYIDCSIKWPNDIMANNKKITGILAEGIFSSKMEALIVGIGINVNQVSFDEELTNKATSLKKELNKDFDIDKLLQEFSINFEYLYQDFLKGNNTYIKICKDNNYLKGKKVLYNDQEIEVIDITDNGNLKVLNDNNIMELHFGEVTLHNTYH